MAAEADPAPAGRVVLGSPGLRLSGRRLLAAIPVLWGVTFLTFVLMNLLPGNAAQELLGANATPAEVRALELKLHLNEPFWTRYWHWLSGVLHGDLGASLTSGQPVTSILAERLPVSFELMIYAFCISVLLAVPVAAAAAHRPGGWADRLSMMVSMAGLSIAPYVLALLLIFIFAVPLGQSVVGSIKSLTLPALAIGLPLACFYTRLLRADMVEQMQGEDYVVTARAKGVAPWQVLIRHAMRNSMFGFLTVLGLNLGTLIGALVIIEPIFALPGIGQVLLQSIHDRDIVVVEAVVLVFALIVVLANLLTDLLYALLDPRIRYGRPAA